MVVAALPTRRGAGLSGRSPYQRARPYRLSPEERESVLALAPERTLPELAAEFGVSHETVRAVLRRCERSPRPLSGVPATPL